MNKTMGLLILIVMMIFSVALSSCGMAEEEALDYSKAENWVEADTEGTKPVDVFFIYPTIIGKTANEDGYASIEEMAKVVEVIRLCQTSVYEESCNVYMPYYRQASMDLAYTCGKDNAAYLDLLYKGKAYADITAALDYYFENCNNGKPFIIAAHSQGSAMSINVLTHYLQEHKDYLPRMVAAYLIGFAPSEEIFNEETGLKFATGEDDFNVVVSFTTEGPTAEGKSALLPEKPMVINPLNWKTDDTYADPSLNLGMGVASPDYTTLTVEPGADDAQINLNRKTLVCTTRTAADYTIAEKSFATESFHQKEYSMYYANLRNNVRVRIEAFFGNAE